MNEWILPCVFLSSFLTGIVIFMLDEEQRALRTVLNLAGAFVKLALVGVVLWGVFTNRLSRPGWPSCRAWI